MTGSRSDLHVKFHLKNTHYFTRRHCTMPAMRDSPMDGIQDQNDVIINRLNLQLARSRSILNSWRPQEQQADDEENEVIDNDDEFVASGETAGIGTVIKNGDESALPTRRSATKDKLLEQLIGKKAANAKRKEDVHKSMSTSKHAVPKPLSSTAAKQPRAIQDSEDEEGGRAAAFKSRKPSRAQAQARAAKDVSDAVDEDGESDASQRKVDRRDRNAPEKDVRGTAVDSLPQKCKGGGSYLDELLSKKAKKSKKKK